LFCRDPAFPKYWPRPQSVLSLSVSIAPGRTRYRTTRHSPRNLRRYLSEGRSRKRAEATVADLRESIRLFNLRYAGGISAYLEVLDGQRSLFDAELTLAQARGSEYQAIVQLYKALGGGWRQ
jgi:outer membrane protein TolC